MRAAPTSTRWLYYTADGEVINNRRTGRIDPNRRRPRGVVIHQTDAEIGRGRAVVNYQNDQQNRHSGYHTILDWDPLRGVTQFDCAPEDQFRAYHVRTGTPDPDDSYNDWIGLAFNYKGDWAKLPDRAQTELLDHAAKLVNRWAHKYGFPERYSRSGGWVSHAELDSSRRRDPIGFPFDTFRDRVQVRGRV